MITKIPRRLGSKACWRGRRSAVWCGVRHGNRLLREVLVALSEVPDFPPARYLWNASHPDVPLHCFLRIRREPVFRIARLVKHEQSVELIVEHGAAGRGRGTRQILTLRRDSQWRLKVVEP